LGKLRVIYSGEVGREILVSVEDENIVGESGEKWGNV
jgi:hypothetical protein